MRIKYHVSLNMRLWTSKEFFFDLLAIEAYHFNNWLKMLRELFLVVFLELLHSNFVPDQKRCLFDLVEQHKQYAFFAFRLCYAKGHTTLNSKKIAKIWQCCQNCNTEKNFALFVIESRIFLMRWFLGVPDFLESKMFFTGA